MKNVYVGRKSIKSSTGVAICKVIDTDITTGNAKVYNRETHNVEMLPIKERMTLCSNIKKLAAATE